MDVGKEETGWEEVEKEDEDEGQQEEEEEEEHFRPPGST